jgi:hypothetical protein
MYSYESNTATVQIPIGTGILYLLAAVPVRCNGSRKKNLYDLGK